MRCVLLIFLLGLRVGINTSEVHSKSGGCMDWGADSNNAMKTYDGEPVRVSCPLFLNYIESNYSLAHAAGLTWSWYKANQGEDLEEIDFHQPENRVSKDEQGLWFWPAFANDSGNYTCMLRNASDCFKVSVSLLVIQKGPDECVSNKEMVFPVELALGELSSQTCPDTSDFSKGFVKSPTAWYRRCKRVQNTLVTVSEVEGQLRFSIVREYHEGSYTCIVTVTRKGRTFNLTRTLHVTITASQYELKPPMLIQPDPDVEVEVEFGQEVNLTCRVYFHYIRESPTTVWWSVDGKQAQELAPAIQVFLREELLKLKDKRITSLLSIRTVMAADLQRNYTCLAQNSKGISSAQVVLVRKAPSYATELGSALGVMLLVLVTLVIVYHFWWIEIILFYRLHFGTDETIGDGKEYDAYISYARNAEEEKFVLMTLQSVLENEYGYKVCIYDRDSLPGGVITDETLACIWKSRRLVVVLSPNYLVNGTQALLELKAGTERMASTGQIRVILVEFQPVRKVSHVAELRRLKAVMTTIKWKGERSRDPKSGFWKQLRLSLPTRGKAHTSRAGGTRLVDRLDSHSPLVSGSQPVANNYLDAHEEANRHYSS